MNRFSFPYPVKPWRVAQEWGVFHPDLSNPGHSIYEQFGFKLHNGTDVALGTDRLIRSPFSGTVIRAATKENGQWQPYGGGIFISVLSDDAFTFDDGVTAHVLADFLHCERLVLQKGEQVLLGTVLAVADNTGFSTGPHTHIQLRRVSLVPAPEGSPNTYQLPSGFTSLQNVDENQANGSFDPTPYFTNTYAQDDLLKGYVKTTGLTWLLNFLKGR